MAAVASMDSSDTQTDIYRSEKTLTLLYMLVAFIALALGSLPGVFQAFEHVDKVIPGLDLNWYPMPIYANYYQGLTTHGVLNALVWTTFFISGFQMILTARSLERPMKVRWLSWAAFGVMMVGLTMSAVAILSGNASVLYTFYLPLQAVWYHYVGLTLVVVGTWLHSANIYMTWLAWRKDNPGEKTPIPVVGVLTTWIVWDMATVGVAIEMLVIAIPWSLGIIPEANPLLARTLFWFFGHPLVYFWLLPAYTSWYGLIPRQAGGKLFSDSLARFAFLLFIILSVPVGLHHQFTDPGVGQGLKAIHAALTYGVIVPSLMTAFTLMASLEFAGKKRGGRWLGGWIMKLPWGDPSFAAQVFAMIIFAAGGVSGTVNASYSLNLVVHNTTWVPGHFHLTLGTAVTLSFMGITYWLLPYVTGRKLFSRGVGVAQAWTWFIGMILFGRGMHWAGLMGAPRRVPFAVAPYFDTLLQDTADYLAGGMESAMLLVGLGGLVLFVSGVLYFTNVIGTFFMPKQTEDDRVDIPITESLHGPEDTPAILDDWRPWVLAAIAIVVLSYGPAIIQVLSNSAFNAPGAGPGL